MLVVSGKFDPITPPSNGESAAETLPNSYVVELPSAGHDPITSAGERGIDLMAAFLSEPTQGPDTACAADLIVDFSADE